jgi:hypothetical protein
MLHANPVALHPQVLDTGNEDKRKLMKGGIMNIVTCTCKKKFAVRIPDKDAKAGATGKIFHTALCPECKMIVRFQEKDTEVINEGKYTGRMEINSV